MSLQQVRSIAFFACTIVVSLAYPLAVWVQTGSALFAASAPVHAWALPILLYIPVQVTARFLVFIGVLVLFKVRGDRDDPSLEDEMDKAIDFRMTRVLLNTVLLGILAGLLALAMGLPAWSLTAGLAAGIWLGSILGDAVALFLYQRGL